MWVLRYDICLLMVHSDDGPNPDVAGRTARHVTSHQGFPSSATRPRGSRTDEPNLFLTSGFWREKADTSADYLGVSGNQYTFRLLAACPPWLADSSMTALSQEENALGRFLKECGKQDKTRAGKMMGATGKTMSYSAQQRLTLRVPLVRLYQEVETYQFRAIADTLATVEKMERSRTDYRGALLWMKDISQQLDPDTYKQLEKFRKVQGHVKRTKIQFEKLKLDTLQKVDLLAASRCNMFSHVLAAYQNALLSFWEKTSSTMSNVAESFKGYQHYDFIVVKELQEPSRKLAEKMGNGEEKASKEDGDKDR
ncbi:hypothetical protein HPB51_021082 [Rhipicephalus microplus]|uniref:AH domain-containing protein n=1 Tax=Rhipicephalus microplus TaxID=6941 RepID=A0A9J6DCJ6_RHIMP|nr:hypothetical protein HPB51_021082 [Rhipicephalus microplus]